MEIKIILYLVGGTAAALLSILAFRIVATLDINKWLERKDQRMLIRLQNACPHDLTPENSIS